MIHRLSIHIYIYIYTYIIHILSIYTYILSIYYSYINQPITLNQHHHVYFKSPLNGLVVWTASPDNTDSMCIHLSYTGFIYIYKYGYIWDLYGIYMGSIWDLYGIYMGFIWDLYGIYDDWYMLDLYGIQNGLYMLHFLTSTFCTDECATIL